MTVGILIKLHLEVLSLILGYTGSSEYTLVKIPHCWKWHGSYKLVIVGIKLVKRSEEVENERRDCA